MRKIVFVCAIIFVSPTNTAMALDQDFKKCILALEHIQLHIKNNTPELSTKLAKGIMGQLMIKTKKTYRKKDRKIQADRIWKEDDLNLCLNYEASFKTQIYILNRVMKNTLPSNPLVSLENCYGALIIIAVAYESKYGPKAGFHKGKEMGTLIAGPVNSVRYLYKQFDKFGGAGKILSQVNEQAMKIYKIYAQKNKKNKIVFFKNLFTECHVFGIETNQADFRIINP
jgi:hypothetical protein